MQNIIINVQKINLIPTIYYYLQFNNSEKGNHVIIARPKLDFLCLSKRCFNSLATLNYTFRPISGIFATISYRVIEKNDSFIAISDSLIIFVHILKVNSKTFREKLFILFFIYFSYK